MVYYVILINSEWFKKCPNCGCSKLILTATRDYNVPIIQCEECATSMRFMDLPNPSYDPRRVGSQDYEQLLEIIRDEVGGQEIWLPTAHDDLIKLFNKINLVYDSSKQKENQSVGKHKSRRKVDGESL